MFGRVDLCDFVLDHPTISRFHAGKYLPFLVNAYQSLSSDGGILIQAQVLNLYDCSWFGTLNM